MQGGQGLDRINGSPINLVQPEILAYKVYEPSLPLAKTVRSIDIRVRVKVEVTPHRCTRFASHRKGCCCLLCQILRRIQRIGVEEDVGGI